MLEAPKANRARFITFEGGEGVGKSTQVKRLLQKLQERAIEVVRTREPGGTPKAEAIRSFILQGRSESWGQGPRLSCSRPPVSITSTSSSRLIWPTAPGCCPTASMIPPAPIRG